MQAVAASRVLLSSRNDRLRGSVKIYQEGRRAFAVEREDVNSVYDRMDGFTTYRQAREEAKCYWG